MTHRVLASSEHRWLALRDFYGTVLDIGAHRGQFCAFAGHSFPGTRVYCFEPQPTARARLAEVARVLPIDVEVFPYAAGAKHGRTQMHISAQDDSSSLLPIAERGQAAVFPGTHEIGLLPVEVRTLDELLERVELTPPVLMKIDVQGAELDVLRGARRVLEQVDDLLVECSLRELYDDQPLASSVLEELFARDFELGDISSGSRDRHGLIQADFLLRRRTTRARPA